MLKLNKVSSQVLFAMLMMVASMPAMASVSDLLTGSLAEQVARTVFGIIAIVLVVMAIMEAFKGDGGFPKKELFGAIITGGLALKWNSIVGGLTSFF